MFRSLYATGLWFTFFVINFSLNFTLKKETFAGPSMTGCNISVMANKISHWLGVTGQSHNIDTACSSSNFAVVKAYEMIQSGDCDAAIIASANLCFHPYIQFQFYHLAYGYRVGRILHFLSLSTN
ncbi:hypothetical protein PUN28_019435 [Cardiocondyla obscurior]|uniref:Beta-ketoacyl synthase-like N-terminal domain-containing protein n=1 Tax=Cardiocondyla obscurior TaxID=286306 RepID=A0AAW2EF61_9HYME